ncbi:type II toxin-antitoxin system HicB family antitoxin [Aeromonas rivipollensis]
MSNNKLMNYKGFYGSIDHDLDAGVLFGKIECINDLITYEAESVSGLKAAFEEAVDDYIETCKAIGKSPEKPMSGSFNIRIGQDLHKKIYIAASNDGKSINDYIKSALEQHTNQMSNRQIHMHFHSTQYASYTGKTQEGQILGSINANVIRTGQVKATWQNPITLRRSH